MSNMSYCRFENTLKDLKDCYEHMDDDKLSEEEKKARIELIEECRDIYYEYAYEIDWMENSPKFTIESYFFKNYKVPDHGEYVVIIYDDGDFEKAIYNAETNIFSDPQTQLEFSDPKYWIRFKKLSRL